MEVWNAIWKTILVWNGRFLVWNGRKWSVWNMEKSSSIPFHTMLWSPLLLLCVYQRQRHPDMEKYILTIVRGSGSVWVHLSTILRVQVWFRFTEVKFCWFRFGLGSPKWNGSFGLTVRVRFDTLIHLCIIICILSFVQSRIFIRNICLKGFLLPKKVCPIKWIYHYRYSGLLNKISYIVNF